MSGAERKGAGKEWEARGLESAGREGGAVATVSTAGRVLRYGRGVTGSVATLGEAFPLSLTACVKTAAQRPRLSITARDCSTADFRLYPPWVLVRRER